MDELYLLRHGIAVEPGTPGVAEDDRPLTSRGRQRMREIASGLRHLGLEPDRIVASPLPRASQTAEIVAAALRPVQGLIVEDVLRAGTRPEALRDWLRGRDESRLMLVGHNPSLSDLVSLLVLASGNSKPICELKKGGVAALRPGPESEGRHELLWIATPRILRRVAARRSPPSR